MSKDLQDSELYEERYHFKEQRSNRRFITVIVLIVLLFLGLRSYWVNTFGGVEVDGESMYPTLRSEQLLLMKTREKAKRGDIIVVYVGGYPEVQAYNEGRANKLEYLIKRLIAVEGDTVKCKDGQIQIQYAGADTFVPLDEPYAHYTDKEIYDFSEYVVGKGEVFFLGDNRNSSIDSRYRETIKVGAGRVRCSHLPDRLYKKTDIVGVVPQWAVDKRETLEKIFFNDKRKNER